MTIKLKHLVHLFLLRRYYPRVQRNNNSSRVKKAYYNMYVYNTKYNTGSFNSLPHRHPPSLSIKLNVSSKEQNYVYLVRWDTLQIIHE